VNQHKNVIDVNFEVPWRLLLSGQLAQRNKAPASILVVWSFYELKDFADCIVS